MPSVFTVTLPRRHTPTFPARCVGCLTDGPDGTFYALDFNGIRPLLVRTPSCARCRLKLQSWQVWRLARTLLIAVVAFFFGYFVLLEWLPGWATGLIVLGLVVSGFAVVFVWSRVRPPAFAIDLAAASVDYEFRDATLAEEFAALNGAVRQDVE